MAETEKSEEKQTLIPIQTLLVLVIPLHRRPIGVIAIDPKLVEKMGFEMSEPIPSDQTVVSAILDLAEHTRAQMIAQKVIGDAKEEKKNIDSKKRLWKPGEKLQ